MSPSTDDITMLKKLLGMTGSSFDGEALAALRKAQDVLRRFKLTWDDVIDYSPARKKRVRKAKTTARDDDPILAEAFRELARANLRGRIADTIWQIKEDWENGASIAAHRRNIVLNTAEHYRMRNW